MLFSRPCATVSSYFLTFQSILHTVASLHFLRYSFKHVNSFHCHRHSIQTPLMTVGTSVGLRVKDFHDDDDWILLTPAVVFATNCLTTSPTLDQMDPVLLPVPALCWPTFVCTGFCTQSILPHLQVCKPYPSFSSQFKWYHVRGPLSGRNVFSSVPSAILILLLMTSLLVISCGYTCDGHIFSLEWQLFEVWVHLLFALLRYH